jgi:hypothetical protein
LIHDARNDEHKEKKNLPFSNGQTWKRKLEEKNNAHVRGLNWLMEEENDEFPELRNTMKRVEAIILPSTTTAREMRCKVARCAAL